MRDTREGRHQRARERGHGEPLSPKAVAAALLVGALAVLVPLGVIGCRALFATGEDAARADHSFGHAQHFRAIKDLKCTDCHKPVAAPAVGGVRGEASSGKYLGLADWGLCQKCHSPQRMPDLQPDVLRFAKPRTVSTYDHEKHAKHAPMECAACHGKVSASTSAADRLTPSMETCWTCHAKVKTFDGQSGARCDLCHVADDHQSGDPEKRRVFAAVITNKVAPSDVPAEVMPEEHARLLGALWLGNAGPDDIPPDHNAMFRSRTHGLRAQEPLSKCYACHTSQQCNECHETSPPPSHTLRFDRSAHGRAATLRRDNCTACHQADFCQSCHEVAPPGHTPDFRRGNHARSARASQRSCFACHAFEEDCARCHNR